MEIQIREMLPEEQKYSYTQSAQLICQTGCIGHLRGDMDTSGDGFFTTWTDHYPSRNTNQFKEEFDQVIHELRLGQEHGSMLRNRTCLAKYCFSHMSSQMEDGHSYGVRVDTDEHTYMCRLNPNKGEYNFYIYAYKKASLEHHMKQAKKGIRFIDSHYNDKFRIQDGEKIQITLPSGEKFTETCRYIDEYHVEVGRNLYHICEFAEKTELNGNMVEPKQ